jgi:hypothetical protein
MKELVVVASHDPDRAIACVASWKARGVTPVLLDTGLGTIPDADANVGPIWQTGAFLYAYREYDVDAFLFTQDTITVVGDDPVGWFRRRMPHETLGAVGWQLFPLAWDTDAQRTYVEDCYGPGVHWARPSVGIVGPVFYVTQQSLDRVAEHGLLPPVPTNREEAAGTERAWAYSFKLAGIPLVGDPFLPDEVPARVTMHGPLKKDWYH